MEAEILKVIGQVAGLAGIAIALATVVFRDVIRKQIFPQLTKDQAYRLLRLIVVIASALAIAGVAAWAYVIVSGREEPEDVLKDRAKESLQVPTKDLETFAQFLQHTGAQVFRIHPRESSQWIEAAGVDGGGSYYSFLRRTQEYGRGNELGLSDGSFYTGFAGADYGYLLALGDVPIEDLARSGAEPPAWLQKSRTDAWEYLWQYKPPSDISEVRKEQDNARGKVVGGNTISERAASVEGMSYLLRAILIDEADLLVGFRAHRRLNDGSFIVVGKILETFDTPIASRSE